MVRTFREFEGKGFLLDLSCLEPFEVGIVENSLTKRLESLLFYDALDRAPDFFIGIGKSESRYLRDDEDYRTRIHKKEEIKDEEREELLQQILRQAYALPKKAAKVLRKSLMSPESVCGHWHCLFRD